MPRTTLFGWIGVWMFALPTVAVEKGTYIEQEVITEAQAGQPKMKGKQQIWLTPNHIRNVMSFGQNTSVAIIDLKDKSIVLMPSKEKQYIQMTLADYQRVVSMRLSGTGLNHPQAKPKLIKTQEKKKIRDWECVKVIFEQGGKLPVKSVMWVSKDIGIDFDEYLKLMERLGMRKMLGRLSDHVSAIQGYPVEVHIEQALHGQKIVSTTRVVRIVKGPVDPALFKIPEGYRQITDELLTKD